MTKNITMKNVLALEINVRGNYINADIDLGSINLKLDDKKFIFDIIQSYRSLDDDEEITTINCDLEIDTETFKDCKFDLKDLDLLSNDVKGEIYFRIDEMDDFIDATLFVKVRQTTKPIKLLIDE